MSNQPQLYSPSSGTLFVAHAVYALHLCSILLGVFTGATVVGAFLAIDYCRHPELHLPF